MPDDIDDTDRTGETDETRETETRNLQVPIPGKLFFQLTDVLTRIDDLLEAGVKASNIQTALLQSIATALGAAPPVIPAVPGVPAVAPPAALAVPGVPVIPGVPAIPVPAMAMWIPGVHPPPLPGEKLIQVPLSTDAVTAIGAEQDKRIIDLKGRRGVFRGAIALFDDENCGIRLVAQDFDSAHIFKVSNIYEPGLADAEYTGITQAPRYDTVNSRYSVTLLQPKVFLDKLQVYLFNTDTSDHNCYWYLALYDYYEMG